MSTESPLTPQQTVSYPLDRIKLIRPENKKRKELESLGARFLTVDITPTRLREEEIFKKRPLAISITEILPRENGQVNTNIDLSNCGGAFINAETHHDEATAVAVIGDLTELIAQMENRPSQTVIATGLSEAVERLKEYLQAGDLDINRYFIDPWAQPQNDFEELAQNYLRFIIGRYNLPLFDVFDVHADPEESDLESHLILGRLQNDPDREHLLYDWARTRFPDISVVFDLEQEQYFQEKLNQSLPDALLTHAGCNRTATMECAGGKSVNEKKANICLMHLFFAMLKDNLLESQEGSIIYDDIRQKLTGQGYKVPLTANQLLSGDGSQPIKRKVLVFPREERGVLRIPHKNRHRILKSGEYIGKIQYSGGDDDQLLYVPSDVESCVILGVPEVGITGRHMPIKEVRLSVAVRDTKLK